MAVCIQETKWRAEGAYLPTLASKAALLEETRLFLTTYGHQKNDLAATVQDLLNNSLMQRSRTTRHLILSIIQARLVRWNPPAWVLDDLVAFAQEPSLEALTAALLLHIPRQDHVLYDFVQHVVVPHKEKGEMQVFTSDVQTFLDASQEEHEEIARWSFETRLRLSRGVLATLRDCRLLKGEVNKYIALPIIPKNVVEHLINLLQAEHVSQDLLAYHDDWRLWLWSPAQAQVAIDAFLKEKEIG